MRGRRGRARGQHRSALAHLHMEADWQLHQVPAAYLRHRLMERRNTTLWRGWFRVIAANLALVFSALLDGPVWLDRTLALLAFTLAAYALVRLITDRARLLKREARLLADFERWPLRFVPCGR